MWEVACQHGKQTKQTTLSLWLRTSCWKARWPKKGGFFRKTKKGTEKHKYPAYMCMCAERRPQFFIDPTSKIVYQQWPIPCLHCTEMAGMGPRTWEWGMKGRKKQAFGLSLCAEDVLFWRNISLSAESERNPRPFLKETVQVPSCFF